MESWREKGRHFEIFALGGTALSVFVLIGADLWWDIKSAASPIHLASDVVFSTLACCGVFYLGTLLADARFRQTKLQNNLERAQGDAEAWMREARQAMEGLGVAIDRQFARWKLSESESDVALLLLKGLSVKEVAGIRNTSEKTVRHQAQAVYEKGGLAGRAELSAFFLEDLMLPSKPPEKSKAQLN